MVGILLIDCFVLFGKLRRLTHDYNSNYRINDYSEVIVVVWIIPVHRFWTRHLPHCHMPQVLSKWIQRKFVIFFHVILWKRWMNQEKSLNLIPYALSLNVLLSCQIISMGVRIYQDACLQLGTSKVINGCCYCAMLNDDHAPVETKHITANHKHCAIFYKRYFDSF